jgi:hypothetical protein
MLTRRMRRRRRTLDTYVRAEVGQTTPSAEDTPPPVQPSPPDGAGNVTGVQVNDGAARIPAR